MFYKFRDINEEKIKVNQLTRFVIYTPKAHHERSYFFSYIYNMQNTLLLSEDLLDFQKIKNIYIMSQGILSVNSKNACK